MNRIITQVKTAVNTTSDVITNENLQSMDDNFAENMDLMQRQHVNATDSISDMKNESITKLNAEMKVLIGNISKDISTNPSIKEARDNILSGMDNSSKEATDTISTIVTSAQSTF